jgi:predicted type IV restriction endonuclease
LLNGSPLWPEEPSEPLVRMLLQDAGVSHVRTKALTDFRELARSAFREFVNLRILQRLDLPSKEKEQEKQIIIAENASLENPSKADESTTVTPLEVKVFNYVKRRLSFLVTEDRLFDEIECVDQRKYKGKFVVFYKKERLGRLFDFYEGRAKKYLFDFGQPDGEVLTDKLADIDKKLLAVFLQRVGEGDSPGKKSQSIKAR